MNSSPKTGDGNYKKSSFINVCKLKRLKNGRYRIEPVDGADRKHENFMWRFFGTINHETSYNTNGISRQELNTILQTLYPNEKYRTYYNSIVRSAIRPRKLF